MAIPPIKTVSKFDIESVVDAIVLAFGTDPAARWMYPDPQQYLNHFPSFVKAFGGKAFEHMSAYCIEGYAGATLWIPPYIHPDEDVLIALVEQSVSQAQQEETFAVFEQMGEYHPVEPHWYLPMIGVVPAQQRKGLGSALLRHTLILCDHDHKLAYLESSNPANVPLYEKHGFEVLGTIQVGSSPPIFPMVRYPR